MKPIISLCLTLFFFSVGYAGPYEYECNASATLHLAENGELLRNDLWDGSSFSVNRISGEIRGDLNNVGWPEKRVIEKGTELSAYSLVWVSSEMPSDKHASKAGYLEIHEWVNSETKPFVVVFSMYVISGTCM